MLLPRIAERLGKKVKGFISLAAPARSLQQLLPEQLTYIQKVSGNIQATPSSPEIKKEVEAVLKTMPASYLKDDATYRPVETAQKTDASYLFLQGGMDYQVTKTDFNMWKDGLKDKRAVFKWYPDLNHIFRVVEGIPMPQDYLKQAPLSGQIITDMVEFIRK